MGLDRYIRKEIIGEGSFGKVSRGLKVLQTSLPPSIIRSCSHMDPGGTAAVTSRYILTAQCCTRAHVDDGLVTLCILEQVYKGRRTGTGQTVAMKFILKHGKSQKDIVSLRQEIEILRGLCHENIIQMLDSFETDQEFCVVTEFAQGASAVPLGPHAAICCKACKYVAMHRQGELLCKYKGAQHIMLRAFRAIQGSSLKCWRMMGSCQRRKCGTLPGSW